MSSKFLIQVVDRSSGRTAATFAPGGVAEKDFLDDCVARTLVKGVGFFKSKKKVEAAMRAAIEESLYDLKAQVHPE